MQLRHARGWELWFRRVRVAGLAAKRFGRWLTEAGFEVPDRVAPDGPIAYTVRAPIPRAGAHPTLEPVSGTTCAWRPPRFTAS